jgi:hypothetical protein
MEPTAITILSPSDTMDILSQKEEELIDVESVPLEPEYSSLAGHIVSTFSINKDAKKDSGVEDEIFDSLRDYNGQYNAKDLASIAYEGGSSIYMNLTATKSRAAMSWIRDILQSANEDAFSIKPTPIPDLPEDLDSQIEEAFSKEFSAKEQEVREQNQGAMPVKAAQDTIMSINRDKRDIREAVLEQINLEALFQMQTMERKIKDDLKEGGWDQALSDFIEDFCIFPAAFLKGPIVTKKDKLRWEEGTPVVTKDYCFINKRVSPIDIYPSPSATCLQKGNLVEHMRFSADELYSFKGIPGYKSDVIDKVLEQGDNNSSWLNTGIEEERATEELRGSSTDANRGVYHGLHFWGSAKTEDLEDWGLLLPDVEDPNKLHEIEAILVGTEVIKCKLNDDPLKRRPYYKASYQNIPGSLWGRSLPNLLRDIQRMCNACARALANNMGLAAGPQIELYIDRLADAGDIEEIKPLKIWQVTNDPTGSSGRAINFFQVPSIANELLGVYDKFEQKADDATGIPRYSYGNEKVGGAAQTASGLGMLLESATKSIKDAIRHIDSGLIIPRVEYQFYWNILKTGVKYSGDINVIAHGSSTLTLKGAQQAKRQEFLQITANDNDQKLMGPEGRAELLRQLAKDLNLTAEIVPSRLALRKEQEERKAQEQQMMEQQASQAQSKTSASIEATKIQAEAQERMHQGTQQMKAQELQLRAADMQQRTEIEREKMQVTANSSNTRAMADSQKANIDAQTKRDIARTNASVALIKGQ